MENSWEKLKADTKKAAVPSGENVREGTGFLEKYLDQLEHFHYVEEQRVYYQGMMDGIEFLSNIGAIKNSTNVKKMIDKYIL